MAEDKDVVVEKHITEITKVEQGGIIERKGRGPIETPDLTFPIGESGTIPFFSPNTGIQSGTGTPTSTTPDTSGQSGTGVSTSTTSGTSDQGGGSANTTSGASGQ